MGTAKRRSERFMRCLLGVSGRPGDPAPGNVATGGARLIG